MFCHIKARYCYKLKVKALPIYHRQARHILKQSVTFKKDKPNYFFCQLLSVIFVSCHVFFDDLHFLFAERKQFIPDTNAYVWL